MSDGEEQKWGRGGGEREIRVLLRGVSGVAGGRGWVGGWVMGKGGGDIHSCAPSWRFGRCRKLSAPILVSVLFSSSVRRGNLLSDSILRWKAIKLNSYGSNINYSIAL